MIKGKSVIEGAIFVSTKEVGGCLSVCIFKKKSMQRNNTITIMQCYSRKSKWCPESELPVWKEIIKKEF